MFSHYIPKNNDYRKATPIFLGHEHTFKVSPDSKALFFSISLESLAHKIKEGVIRRVLSKIERNIFQSIKHVIVKVEMGEVIYTQKVILLGFSKDNLLYNDLLNNWFEIIVPLPGAKLKEKTKTVKISILSANKNPSILEQLFLSRRVLLTEPVCIKNETKRNIVYITLESLTDISYLYQKKLISESTYALYKEVFKDFIKVDGAIAQTDWTFPAVVSYHTGLLTSQHRMYNSERIKRKEDKLDNKILTIAELMKQEGYVTFSANLGKLNTENGFAKGIDCYFKPSSSLGFIEYTGDDKWVIKKLEMFKENCFIHLHYDRLHHPLFSTTGPWSRIRNQINPILDDRNRLLNAEVHYEANLRMLLYEVNNIITYLKMNSQFNETIFVVIGDHGLDFGEWIDQKQESPCLDSRVMVPYLINQKSSVKTKNASLRPMMEFCDITGVKLPEYFSLLPQMDKELGQYCFFESVLKSKGDMYILAIFDDKYKHVLHAYVNWDNFSLQKIEKEYTVNLTNNQLVQDKSLEQKFQTIRKRFFELNGNFYKNFYGSRA